MEEETEEEAFVEMPKKLIFLSLPSIFSPDKILSWGNDAKCSNASQHGVKSEGTHTGDECVF